jgi:hypothetical protein
MSDVTVITNNVPRDVVEAYELTPEERKDLDYINWDLIEKGEDSASFFRYKGEVYDLGGFEPCRDPRFSHWHGYQNDSFFSGILIRYTSDYEQVVVGRFYS